MLDGLDVAMLYPAREQRRPMWTHHEKTVLRLLMRNYAGVTEFDPPDVHKHPIKNEMWRMLTARYNAQPNVRKRDTKQLRKAWENLKYRARKLGEREKAAANTAAAANDGDANGSANNGGSPRLDCGGLNVWPLDGLHFARKAEGDLSPAHLLQEVAQQDQGPTLLSSSSSSSSNIPQENSGIESTPSEDLNDKARLEDSGRGPAEEDVVTVKDEPVEESQGDGEARTSSSSSRLRNSEKDHVGALFESPSSGGGAPSLGLPHLVTSLLGSAFRSSPHLLAGTLPFMAPPTSLASSIAPSVATPVSFGGLNPAFASSLLLPRTLAESIAASSTNCKKSEANFQGEVCSSVGSTFGVRGGGGGGRDDTSSPRSPRPSSPPPPAHSPSLTGTRRQLELVQQQLRHQQDQHDSQMQLLSLQLVHAAAEHESRMRLLGTQLEYWQRKLRLQRRVTDALSALTQGSDDHENDTVL